MFKDAFSKGHRAFSIALIGLGVLFLVTVCMFAAVLIRTYQADREWRERRDDLRAHWEAWQQQGIDDYRVQITAINSTIYCQSEMIEVVNDAILEEPACAQNPYGYYSSYSYLATVDGAFRMVDDWMNYNQGREISIQYHPELDYISHVEFDTWSGLVVLEYQNLQPK